MASNWIDAGMKPWPPTLEWQLIKLMQSLAKARFRLLQQSHIFAAVKAGNNAGESALSGYLQSVELENEICPTALGTPSTAKRWNFHSTYKLAGLQNRTIRENRVFLRYRA
jgi:hypothetical protein